MKFNPRLRSPFVLLAVIVLIIAVGLYYLNINKTTLFKPKSETLLVINDSGSTNWPGYALTINVDGSGSLRYEKNHASMGRPYPSDTDYKTNYFDASKLSTDLEAVGDISKITEGLCAKSASFGTSTTLTYMGQTSVDLQCISDSDLQINKDLASEVLHITNSL